MRKTTFAGLTLLEPGEGLDTDDAAFIDRDRQTIDHFLQLGAKLHRHNAQVGLENPTQAASGAIIASGGSIAADTTISIGYTIEDAQGGETQISPLTVVSTGPPMDIPPAAPSAAFDNTGGALLVDTYYYAVTWIDATGGETPAGPAVAMERPPGFASGRILLTNLNYGMAAAGAVGWRLYRAVGGGSFDLLTTGGAGIGNFTDDGTTGFDCDTHPPENINTTKNNNTLLVTLPTADANMSRAQNINLYGTITGDFNEGSSLGQYPLSSAGRVVAFTALSFNEAVPPDVNLSVGGASLIDPDTELLDWHWKRPVAASGLLGSGSLGDVKLVEGNGQLFAVLQASAANPTQWVRIASATGGGGGTPLTASAAGISIPNVSEIDFFASGAASVSLRETAAGRALVTIAAASGSSSGGSPLTASASGAAVSNVTELDFLASGGGGVSVRETSPGHALVTIAAPDGTDIERFWASATTPSIASGASGTVTFPASASIHMFRISTDKRARVRVYGSEAARTADLNRPIGTDPTGDHGVQLDYANTAHASGGVQRITPIVHGVNLKNPPEDALYLTIDNFDATGPVTVAFLYTPIEMDDVTVAGASSGGAGTIAASATGGRFTGLTELDFLGASGAVANIASLGGGVARITITPEAKIVRGQVNIEGEREGGKGFSAHKVSTGVYVLKWDQPWPGGFTPILCFTPIGDSEERPHPQLGGNEAGECTVTFWKGGVKVDCAFQFTATSQAI